MICAVAAPAGRADEQLPAISRSGSGESAGDANPLHLSPSQEKQIAAIKSKFIDQARVVIKDPGLTPAQQNAKVSALETKAVAGIQACLTPAQRQKMSQEQSQVNKGQSKHDSQIAALQARIKTDGDTYVAKRKQLVASITPDQKKAIIALENDTTAKVRAIQADKTLSSDDVTKKVNDLTNDYVAKRLAIFTAAQQALFTQLADLDTDAQEAQAQINRLNPVMLISPKP